MTIAPIRQTVSVKGNPARAFRLFTEKMHGWWPEGKTIGPQPRANIMVESHVGGRWFEISESGVETLWGRVLVWEPPHRLVLAWQINAMWQYDAELETQVELRFNSDSDRTRVDFEHRDLERFGPSAEQHAAMLGSGWPTMIGRFVDMAEEQNA